jgi:hypothetical protein
MHEKQFPHYLKETHTGMDYNNPALQTPRYLYKNPIAESYYTVRKV